MNLWSGQLYKSLFLDNKFTRKLNITVKSRIKNSLQWTRNNEIPPSDFWEVRERGEKSLFAFPYQKTE